MRVKSARFVTSGADAGKVPYSPQISVAGRSNCGKSSLLNMLMGAKLARTSSTPGRTRLINVFELVAASDIKAAEKFFLVDLPGYGYSKAARNASDEWNARTEAYFAAGGENIAQTLCLMDIRRDPSDLDKVLINFLRDMGYGFTVVLTKADKLSRAQIGNAKTKIASALGLATGDIIVTSASSGQGRQELLDRIERLLSVFASE